MALDVIGAGFGRTGTLSLKTALEMLGFAPCHHMLSVRENREEQTDLWSRISDGETVSWDEVFKGFRAMVDWPGCHYYAELADYYPDAKVILSLRDPESWYNSMTETLFPSMLNMREAGGMAPDSPLRFADQIIGNGTFGRDFSKENAIAVFERHNAEVQRRIPSDRLLVYRVSEGWEPLCTFLGVPVPDVPFPRVNARQQYQNETPWREGAAGEA